MAQQARSLFDADSAATAPDTASTEEEPPPPSAAVRSVGWVGRNGISATGALLRLTDRVFIGDPRSAEVRTTPGALLLRQVHLSGVRALPLVALVAVGTGMAIVLQAKMAPTPPSGEFGRMLVVVVLRELAPLLTALIVVGHSGTAMAAELGPAELALARSRGALAWPRVAGATIALSVLAVYFAAIAMFAGYATSQALTLRTFDAVRAGFQQELSWFDAPLFLFKTAGLGAIVGYVSLRFALEARASAAGVALAASRAYVWSLVGGGGFSIGVTVVRYVITGAPQPP